MGKVVFAGVGWWQYQKPPGAINRSLIARLSHPMVPHAVRDNYTAVRLTDMGVPNVMTGCPTMWGLHGASSALTPGQTVVASTITDYYANGEVDRRSLRTLTDHYGEVVVVGMGPGDEGAYRRMGDMDRVRWLGYGTEALIEARRLTTDHVGTRLHAAVRWMELGGASLVLSVDNRATEIGKDTGLPVIERGDIGALRAELSDAKTYTVEMPMDAIAKWKLTWESWLKS